jgi:Tfp pilus assembly protein PilO
MLPKLPSWSKQNTLIMAILFISLVAMYNWFIVPHTQYLIAAQKCRDVAIEIEKKSKTMNSELASKQKRLHKLTARLEQWKETLFDIDQAKNFLSNIQSTIEKSGCVPTNLQLSPPKDIIVRNDNSVYIQQYQAGMSLTGKYENIVNLLYKLQNRKAKVWIDSITISATEPASNYLSCDITLSIYTLKDKENAGVKNK